MDMLLWNSNLFRNPLFTTAGALSSGLDEWDTLGPTFTSVTGNELTSSGNPGGGFDAPQPPWIVGGIEAQEGPWGLSEYASLISPEPGQSFTFTALVSSNSPAVKVSLGFGQPAKGDTPPVPLATTNAAVTEGEPTTRVYLEATIPADYVFDGTNGLTVTMDAANASYIRITKPWFGYTVNNPWPVLPDPGEEPETPGEEPSEPFELDPLAKRVAAMLARKGEAVTEELASEHLMVVRVFVWGYTRGRGFTDRDPMKENQMLAAVIVSACMRLTANPEQLDSYTAGDYSERGATLKGFSLPELAVLNNYRRRTR